MGAILLCAMPERLQTKTLALEAAELTSCDPETSAVLCDTFLYEPEPGEDRLGSLFFVLETIDFSTGTRAETNEARDPARDLLGSVARTLREEYYRDPIRPMVESFEAALENANRALAARAQSGDSAWLENLHGAVGAFSASTLHVSRVGGADIVLARRGKLTDIGEGLSEPNARHPQRAFTSIASGTASEADGIVLATPGFSRLVPRDRLAGFLTGKHPRETAVYARDLLAETADAPPFGVLFLRATKAPIALPAPQSVGGPLPGRAGGVAARPRGTPPSLQSPFRPPVARPVLRLRQSRLQRLLTIGQRAGRLGVRLVRTAVVPVLLRAARAGASSTRRTATTVAGAARARLQQRGEHAVRDAPAAPPIRSLPRVVAERAHDVPQWLRATYQRWPASTKAFFALTVLLLVLLIGSVVFLRQRRIEDAAVRAASERLQEARVKKEAADAALIYENLDEARRLMREARAGAQAIAETPYYHAEVAGLLAAIQVTEDHTERITRVDQPTLVGDFRSVAPGGSVRGLAAIGDHVFSFVPENNAILRLRADNGEASVVSQTSQGIGYFRRASPLPTDAMVLFATDSPGLALFDTTKGDLIKQEVDPIPEGAKEIRGLATFGSRLYLLFPDQKQVLGYSKTLSGFTGGAPWIKAADLPVERAVDLGVDGYIYLLTNDGTIVKLLKGTPVEFAQAELSRPLSSPTRLVITEQLKYLYVLDPNEKRVVVYDTTGKLSRQFVFPNARELNDITVAGKDETLFVLDGTTVYRVPLK